MSFSNPWNVHCICYFTCKKELCRCDYESLNVDIILDYPAGSHVITGSLIRERQEIRITESQ